jgi:hypothetical protein
MKSWKDVKLLISQNHITLDRLDKVAEDIMASFKLDLEYKCLVSAVATNSCRMYKKAEQTKLCQAFFTSKDKNEKSKFIANFVSSAWLHESIAILQSLADIDEASNMNVQLLISGMEFIESSFVIDNAKKLVSLKEKRDLDWPKVVDQILEMSSAKQLKNLHESADSAKKYLGTLLSPSTAEPVVSAEIMSVPIARKTSLVDLEKQKRAQRLEMMKSQARGMDVRQHVSTAPAPAPVAKPIATTIPRMSRSVPPQPASQPVRPSSGRQQGTSGLFTAGPKEPPKSAWPEAKPDVAPDLLFAANSVQRTRDASRIPPALEFQVQPESRFKDSEMAREPQQHRYAPQAPAHSQHSVPSRGYAGGYSGYQNTSAGAPPVDYNRGSSSSFDVGGARGGVAWENSASSQSNVVATSHDNQTDGGRAYGGYGSSDLTVPAVLDHRTDYLSYQGSQKRPYQQTDNNSNNNNTANYKRSREDGYRTDIPPPSEGAGRGRGRGSHLNKPAWMTAGNPDGLQGASSSSNASVPQGVNSYASSGPQDPYSYAGGSQGANNNGAPPRSNPNPQGRSNPNPQGRYAAPAEGRYAAPTEGRYAAPAEGRYVAPAEGRYAAPGGVDTGRGRGRGIHMNTPAWLTDRGGNNAQHPGSENVGLSAPPAPRPTEPPMRGGFPDAGPPGGGRGRGRGGNINLPAWMTQSNSGDDV